MIFRALVALLCMAGFSNAAIVGVAETWPDSSLQGWQDLDHSSGILSNQNLTVSEGALQLTPVVDPEATLNPRWSFVASAAASAGIFSGSFYDIGAHTLEFDFYSSVPMTLTVQWANESEFIIYVSTGAASSGELSTRISVPLDLDQFSPDQFSSDDFEGLMRNTEQIWFRMDWDKDAAMPVFRIDNMELLGAGTGYGAWIDGFGLPFGDRLSGVDADGDGDDNAVEFIVDSLPNDPDNQFSFNSDGMGMQWNSSLNCQYTVLRSTNLLSQAFESVDFLSGTGGVQGYQEEENIPSAFYKLEVGRK